MASPDRVVIKEMPSKEALEAFLTHGSPKVVFNRTEGKFEWINPADRIPLGTPKTEFGRRMREI